MIDVLIAAVVATTGFLGLLSLTADVLRMNQLAIAALNADVMLLDFKAHMLTAYNERLSNEYSDVYRDVHAAAHNLPKAGKVCAGDQPPWVVEWCGLGALDDFSARFGDIGLAGSVLCLAVLDSATEVDEEQSIMGIRYALSLSSHVTPCQPGEFPLVRDEFRLRAGF